jgi:SAM-dependent methyltransferase
MEPRVIALPQRRGTQLGSEDCGSGLLGPELPALLHKLYGEEEHHDNCHDCRNKHARDAAEGPRIILAQVSRSERINHEVSSILYPSAVILSRFIWEISPSLLGKSKSVLELGSGTGLCGLAAALSSPKCHVVLSDRDQLSLSLQQRNIAANKLTDRVFAAYLDWDNLPPLQSSCDPLKIMSTIAKLAKIPSLPVASSAGDPLPECAFSAGESHRNGAPTGENTASLLDGQFDIVLGSECVHEGPKHAAALYAALRRFVKPGGCAIFVHWSASSCYGIDSLSSFASSVDAEADGFGPKSVATVILGEDGYLRRGVYEMTGFSPAGKDCGMCHELTVISRSK